MGGWHALGLALPIVQAPMAGTSTPELAAAVSDAGALGSVSIASSTIDQAARMIDATAALTRAPVNINVFCHRRGVERPDVEAAWTEHLRPWFTERTAEPADALSDAYSTLRDADDQLALLLDRRPAVVSLHLGLPDAGRIAALRDAGIVVLASVTSAAEARLALDAGIDVLVAQGIEAGGHREVFETGDDPGATLDDLLRDVVASTDVPVVAAGGLMDGADVARVLDLGACAAQLGTAFVRCPESSATDRHRRAVQHGTRTALTSVVSGRPARGVVNRFHVEVDAPGRPAVPDFARAYAAGKALIDADVAAGREGFGAHWAGTGLARSRALPAAELVAALADELAAARER